MRSDYFERIFFVRNFAVSKDRIHFLIIKNYAL